MAKKWVLDCSAMAAAMLMEAEGEDVDALLNNVLEEGGHVLVPALFWYEISNVLVTAVRKKRLEVAQARDALIRLSELPIETDTTASPIVYRRIFDFALKHGLSVYDAAYVELADRFNACLKTYDRALLGLRHQYAWIR